VSKPKARQTELFDDPVRGPILTVRSVIALLLFVLGVAWIVYYYLAVRPDPTVFPIAEPGGPAFLGDLGKWNYVIGFGLAMVALAISAHPSTPLGRGRGVVVGMLACFLIGLLWICTFYVFSDDTSNIPVFNDLGQYNLVVGIALMAVGFTFATRWE
jgi:drug/metabolite transporter (DMT)-like permease